MSLINDALKQTRQSRPQTPLSVPPILPPAESTPSGGGSWLAPVVMILLFAAAGIFVGLSLSKRSLPVAAAANVIPVTHPLPVSTNPPSPVTNTVVALPPKPELKLQGILLAATRPCAIVNGKTLFVGDQVNGLRVTAISKDSVTLQSQTEMSILSLSRR